MIKSQVRPRKTIIISLNDNINLRLARMNMKIKCNNSGHTSPFTTNSMVLKYNDCNTVFSYPDQRLQPRAQQLRENVIYDIDVFGESIKYPSGRRPIEKFHRVAKHASQDIHEQSFRSAYRSYRHKYGYRKDHYSCKSQAQNTVRKKNQYHRW